MSKQSFGEFIEILNNLIESKKTSLPRFTKQTIITCPVYLQKSISEEPVINDVLANTMNFYCGYIFSALNLNQYISSSTKVRDFIAPVTSETYLTNTALEGFDEANDIVNKFANPSMEASGDKSKFIESKTNYLTSRILEVSIRVDEKQTVSVILNVQIFPRIIPDKVAEAIIDLNVKPSLTQRWIQLRTGEISFWKDFIFAFDKLKKRREALKEDKNQDLYDFNVSSRYKFTNKVSNILSQNKSHNISNRVMIYDETSFKKYCNNVNLNINNPSDRSKFFSRTFSMMLWLINPMYNTTTLYVDAIDTPGTFTFDQLKSNSKTDKVSMADVMEMFAKSQMPRY